MYLFDTCRNNGLSLSLGNHVVVFNNYFACFGIYNVAYAVASDKSVLEGFDCGVADSDCGYPDTVLRAAVLFSYDNVLCNVDKSSGKIT